MAYPNARRGLADEAVVGELASHTRGYFPGSGRADALQAAVDNPLMSAVEKGIYISYTPPS
jgi:hypothetical protein